MVNTKKGNNAIWYAFRSGKKEAFSELFFIYYSTLYQYGLKMTGKEELVKDVIQDFFLYLFENRMSLPDEVQNTTAYLLTSFRRRMIGEIARQKAVKTHPDGKNNSGPQQFVIGIEDVIIKQESDQQSKEIILKLLNELPPRQREIIYLKYYQNLSLQEIADMLSISYQVVANHLYRALKKMQKSDETQKFAKGNFWLFLTLCL